MRPSELSCVTIMIASHANFVFTYASDFFEINGRLCTKNHHVNVRNVTCICRVIFELWTKCALPGNLMCQFQAFKFIFTTAGRANGGCTTYNKPFHEYLFLYWIFKLNLRSFIEKLRKIYFSWNSFRKFSMKSHYHMITV